MTILDELVQKLALERLEVNLYRGQSEDPGWGIVYGGHVLGQALSAAQQTVDAGRPVHSLHAYFLRPGDVTVPIVYDVDRARDGSSFTTRRVTAIQHGEAIFNLAASFQKVEPGVEHQDEMPLVPAPEEVPTDQERLVTEVHRFSEPMRSRVLAERPIEIRTVGEIDPHSQHPSGPDRAVWFRTIHRLPDDVPGVHQAMLAYASDTAYLSTALKPHGLSWLTPGMQVASIDHAVWFHAPFRADSWLLHVIHSPRASGARGLVMGRIFSRDGRLVASTAQEGLIRRRPPPP
jgi:acyl-CoA thioesterase-2